MSKLPIISASDRLKEERGITGCIFGSYGIGKTSLLWTLRSSSTLFVDLEAGDLAVAGWKGDTVRPKTWPNMRDLAVYIAGDNNARSNDKAYSKAHFESARSKFGDVDAKLIN